MKSKKLILFAAIPTFTNLLFIGLYFSGIESAQQIVSPTIEWLSPDSWREFGIMEQIQSLYLLAVTIIFVTAASKRTLGAEKLFFLSGALLTLFVLLEEIDYGIHFYEYFTGQPSLIETRNWHNQGAEGDQYVKYLKQLVDIVMVLWFVLLPLLKARIRYPLLKSILPSRWFIIALVLGTVFSRIAHLLQGMEWDVINGRPGGLQGNISEFRETNTYYLYLLYAVQLSRTSFNISENGKKKRQTV